MKQAKYLFPSLCMAFCLALPLLPLRAEPDTSRPTPPPEWIQARVFRNLNLADFSLKGTLRTPKGNHPIELKTRGQEMLYLFKDSSLQIRVILDPSTATVERRSGDSGEWQTVSGKTLLQPVLDSDVTYEDLGLGFIFWDNVRGIGADSIKTLPAWALEAKAPVGTTSRYVKVRYWISSQFYAFLRVDGYNGDGQVIKRVEVNGVQQIGKVYVIKEMQVATMIPGRELSASRTYIDVDSGTPGSGL